MTSGAEPDAVLDRRAVGADDGSVSPYDGRAPVLVERAAEQQPEDRADVEQQDDDDEPDELRQVADHRPSPS